MSEEEGELFSICHGFSFFAPPLSERARSSSTFEVSGAGEIVATDNGDPTDRQVFSSPQRDAFSGMALAIVKSRPNQSGEITVTASAGGLTSATVTILAN